MLNKSLRQKKYIYKKSSTWVCAKQFTKSSQTLLLTDGGRKKKNLISEYMCLSLQCCRNRNNGHAQSAYMTAEEQREPIPMHFLMDLLMIVAQIYLNSFIFIIICGNRFSQSGSQQVPGAPSVRWEYTLQGTLGHPVHAGCRKSMYTDTLTCTPPRTI